MTSVLGHLNEQDFAREYRKWNSCAAETLFEAPIVDYVDKVGHLSEAPGPAHAI